MTFEGNGGGMAERVPPHHDIPHYHGDEVRVLFFTSAVVILIAQSTGADLPLSVTGSVLSAVLLVIAAGITNPAEYRIHWLNALVAIAGTILFGTNAIENYRVGISLFDRSFIYIEALALLSLVALYYTTATIRGISQRSDLF